MTHTYSNQASATTLICFSKLVSNYNNAGMSTLTPPPPPLPLPPPPPPPPPPPSPHPPPSSGDVTWRSRKGKRRHHMIAP